MNIYELEIKMYLLKNIDKENCLEKISTILDSSFLKSETMKNYHKSCEYKGYNFNSFYPLEEKIYLEGKIYTVKLRVLENKMKSFFEENLAGLRSEDIQILTVKTKKVMIKHITEIYSLTPAVCKFENGYWKTSESIEIFEKRIKDNAIKKYNFFYSTKLAEDFDFIKKIEFKNRIPIAVNYKNIKFLGDKVQIELEDNEISQKLGYIIYASGLLELGARGYGFVNAKFI
ncbi:MAG: CRISPR-associated endoribonuclease Cas6 [Fusobacteriaceae bacterium]